MSGTEILAILALTVYAVYRQTRVDEVNGPTRFKMATIYIIVGLCVGGFDTPSGVGGWAMIVAGLALSVVVGLFRGGSRSSGWPTTERSCGRGPR